MTTNPESTYEKITPHTVRQTDIPIILDRRRKEKDLDESLLISSYQENEDFYAPYSSFTGNIRKAGTTPVIIVQLVSKRGEGLWNAVNVDTQENCIVFLPDSPADDAFLTTTPMIAFQYIPDLVAGGND